MNAVSKGRKQRLIKYMGGQCAKCGYDRCINALQFHKLFPGGPKLSSNLNKLSEDTLIKQANMCVLLCSNCRYELLAGQWYIQQPNMLVAPQDRILHFVCESEILSVPQLPPKLKVNTTPKHKVVDI